MRHLAIVLYGPPAAGKDTITRELTRLDSRYVPLRRLKVGGGKSEGYRPASRELVEELRARGHVLYENQRYDNTYVVDEPSLTAMLAKGATPVIHLGQLAGVRAVKRHPAAWIAVLLGCGRQACADRTRARGSSDVDLRLAAWDETMADLQDVHSEDFALRIDTEATSVQQAAAMIHAYVGSAAFPTRLIRSV